MSDKPPGYVERTAACTLDTKVGPKENPIDAPRGELQMTVAHRIDAVVAENGTLSLDHLPFRPGQAVEVIVLPVNRPAPADHPLRGSVLRYDCPTEPVAEGDWDALR